FQGCRIAGCDDEQLGCRRRLWTAEDWRRDEALSGVRMRLGEALRERDADRAHRKMDGALGEALDNAVLCQRYIGDRGIVRKHRDNHLSMTGISNAACLVCTQFEQRATLLGVAVEHGDIMSDRKSTRLNSSHRTISYAVFC